MCWALLPFVSKGNRPTSHSLHTLSRWSSKHIRRYRVSWHALKLYWTAFFLLVLVALIYCGQWTNLPHQSQNGAELATKGCLIKQLIADGVYSMMRTLQDIFQIPSPWQAVFCVFLEHTFVPISWVSKRKTVVSRTSIECEILSLDAGSSWKVSWR